MKLKIAIVQFKIDSLPLEKTLKKTEKFIKKGAALGAKIIVFPEYLITEVGTDKIDEKNKYPKYFQKLAKKYKIDIVPGSMIEKSGSKLYNTTYYIDSNGGIKSKYRKRNLWGKEKEYLSSGKKTSVFRTRFGKIGLVICWDLIFPEVFIEMRNKGVEIVICPSYWCFGDAGEGVKLNRDSEIILVNSLCIERAFENEIIMVYCNAADEGKSKSLTEKLIGCSQITEPFKGAIKRLNHNKEEMFIQEIDTSILKVAEQAYKIREDSTKS